LKHEYIKWFYIFDLGWWTKNDDEKKFGCQISKSISSLREDLFPLILFSLKEVAPHGNLILFSPREITPQDNLLPFSSKEHGWGLPFCLLPKESTLLLKASSLKLKASSLKKLPKCFFFHPFCSWKGNFFWKKAWTLNLLVEKGDYNHQIFFFPFKYCVKKK